MNLKAYLRLLKDHKWILLFSVIASLLLVTLYFAFRGPVYVARADLLVQDYDARSGGLFQEFQHVKKEIKTRLLLLQGEQVLGEVVKQLDLAEKFKVSSDGEAVRILQNKIAAYEEEFKSNVITIEVEDRDPELAASLANHIADTYVQKDFEETYYLSKKITDWAASPGEDTEEQKSIELLPSITRDPLINDLRSRRMAAELKIQQFEKEFRFPPTDSLKNELLQIDKLIEERKQEILRSLSATVKDGLLPPTLRVVNYAHPPQRPSRSKQVKVTVLAIYFAFLVTFGVLVLRESSRRTLRIEEDLRNNFFLGYLPKEEKRPEGPRLSPAMRSAIQMVRASFFFCISPAEEKCFLVTSPSASQGKSLVAGALAASTAQQGVRTVLVDCDFQRSRFFPVWNIPSRTPTLFDFLSGRAEAGELGVQTEIENLEVIPAASGPVKSPELLTGPKMEALVGALKLKYDQVLIDAPSVLETPEALFLCRWVQGVILVTRYRQTGAEAYEHTLRKLKNVGAVVKGTVINDFDAVREKSHYYSRYYAAPESGGAKPLVEKI